MTQQTAVPEGKVFDEEAGDWVDRSAPSEPMKHTGPLKGGLASMPVPESAIPDSLLVVPKKDCFFVAYWGSDLGGDGSIERPWRTINLAERMKNVGSGLDKTAIIVLLKKP